MILRFKFWCKYNSITIDKMDYLIIFVLVFLIFDIIMFKIYFKLSCFEDFIL